LPCIGPLQEAVPCALCRKTVQHCKMGSWTEWDTCDKKCDGGQKHRQRQIVIFPRNGGKECPDAMTETTGCNTNPCSADHCEVSQWSAWSTCSAKCGVGQKHRKRSFLKFRSEGGRGCEAEPMEQVIGCNREPCEKVDCEWGEWLAWGDCSCKCDGGKKVRNRHIKTFPKGGGKPCDEVRKEEVSPCNTQRCDEHCIDGAWSSWSAWTDCSASCGGGTKFRKRQVHRMANHCGKPPEGLDTETRFCNVNVNCEPAEDCEFSAWSRWSACSATCEGITRRSRRIVKTGRGDGAWCRGALKQTAPCNPRNAKDMPSACKPTRPPLPCKVSEWTTWSSCSASCAGGSSTRERTIIQEPSGGGLGCDSSLAEVRQCNRRPCKEKHRPVDCTIGDWQDWGACGKCGGSRKRFRHILQFPAHGGNDCVPTDIQETGTCQSHCAHVEYCSWVTWGPWSVCSAKCGNATRKRTRTLQTFSSADGHPPPKALAEIMQKYSALQASTESLQTSHLQEMILAFACGGMSLLAALGVYRLSLRIRLGRQEAVADGSLDLTAMDTPLTSQ